MAASSSSAPSRPKFNLLAGSEPALGFLESLGVNNDTAKSELLEHSVALLVDSIPSAPPARLAKLLSAAFAHVDSPQLRPVAIAALEHATELPQDIVKELTSERRRETLLAELPLRVRQRVWETEDPPNLFINETHPMLFALIEECEARFAHAHDAAEVPPKRRRMESKALQSLAALVSAKSLYAAFSNLLREGYANEANPAFGAVRSDLMLVLHEAGEVGRPVARWEGLHTFICCLDAASREQRLEARALQILINHAVAAGLPLLTDDEATIEQSKAAAKEADSGMSAGAYGGPSPQPNFIETVQHQPQPLTVLADLAMLLAPPPVLQLLTETLYDRLEAVVDAHSLPGSDKEMRMIVQLHALARAAPTLRMGPERRQGMVDKWPSTMSKLLHQALPVVAELIVDDQMRETAGILGDDGGGGSAASTSAAAMLRLPEGLEAMFKNYPHARHVILMHMVRRVEAADEARVEQLLPMVVSLEPLQSQMKDYPEFAGGLVSALIADPTKCLTPRIARAAISKCLLPLAQQLPQAHTQLLRLLTSQWQLLHAMPAESAAGDTAGIMAAAGVATVVSKLTQGNALDGKGKEKVQNPLGEAVISLLQHAARKGNEVGATEAKGEKETERAYDKLARLVPGLMGGRGRLGEGSSA